MWTAPRIIVAPKTTDKLGVHESEVGAKQTHEGVNNDEDDVEIVSVEESRNDLIQCKDDWGLKEAVQMKDKVFGADKESNVAKEVTKT